MVMRPTDTRRVIYVGNRRTKVCLVLLWLRFFDCEAGRLAGHARRVCSPFILCESAKSLDESLSNSFGSLQADPMSDHKDDVEDRRNNAHKKHIKLNER